MSLQWCRGRGHAFSTEHPGRTTEDHLGVRSRPESERLVRKLFRQVMLGTLPERLGDGEEGIDFRNIWEVGKNVFSIEDIAC